MGGLIIKFIVYTTVIVTDIDDKTNSFFISVNKHGGRPQDPGTTRRMNDGSCFSISARSRKSVNDCACAVRRGNQTWRRHGSISIIRSGFLRS